MKPISTDSSSFKKLRQDGCIYVDKTEHLYRLLTPKGRNCFFISRPRRFGKSLMISTLKAIFEGKRELFDGLKIASTDWSWESFPVLHFNFGFAAAPSASLFLQTFATTVQSTLENAGWKYLENKTPTENFGLAIDYLSFKTGRTLAILIDEYDDPVARLLDCPNDAEYVRGILAGFYGQMKDRTEKIRFLMITGVSKFTKLSVFSSLSNLNDLSFDDDYSAMLGFTENELDDYFKEHMKVHASKLGLQYQDYRNELKRWFNGYRFWLFSGENVYNPVSIALNLSKCAPMFCPCWTDTGQASMLMKYLQRNEFLQIDMESVQEISREDFSMSNLRNLRAVPLLFQTGYLTIKNYNKLTDCFELAVPDEEVRRDFARLLTAQMAQQDEAWASHLGLYLLSNKWDKFFVSLQSLFAHLPYGPKENNIQEFSYERVLYTLFASKGFSCRTEDRQANGQADIIAQHPCGIFIFELKVDKSAEAAVEQIRNKQYHLPYLSMNLPIWFIGLNFDSKTHLLIDIATAQVK